MPRTVTVTLSNNATHTYENVPDNVTPEQVEMRALKDFPGVRVTDIKRAAPAAAPQDDMKVSLGRDIAQKVESTAAGFGRGVGNVALTGQDWLGQAVSALGGADMGGDWLQQNAREGQARLTAEAAPYKERNPYAFGGGKIGGEVVGVSPILRAGGAVLNAAKMPTFGAAFESGGMVAPNAFMRALGGGTAGFTTSALTDPDSMGLGTAVGALIPSAVVPAVNKVTAKIAEKATPTTLAIKDQAKKLYTAIDQSGARILQPVVQQFSAGMDNFVKNTQQYLAKGHSAVNTALAELNGFANAPLSITRLNTFYKDLRKSAQRIGGSEGSVLDAMADKVNSLMDNLTPRDLGGASTRDITNLRAANDLQHRAYKSEVIDDILRKATLKAEGETSAVSQATAIQRGFQALASNNAKMKAFTPDERAMIEKVARGDYKTKILGLVSSLKPGMRVDLRTLLYALGGSANLPAATAVAAGAGAANMWRNALVKGQGQNVGRFIRNKGAASAPQVRPPFALTPAGVSASQQASSSRKKNSMVK